MFLPVPIDTRKRNQLVFSKRSNFLLFLKLPLIFVFLFVVVLEIKRELHPSHICANCREKGKKPSLLGILEIQDLAELQMVSCRACISRCSEENGATRG